MDAPRPPAVQRLVDGLALFDDWEERYRALIDLGKRLAPLTDEQRVEANRVQGCVSQVWLVNDPEGAEVGHLAFRADSDSFIMKGLLALLLSLYNDRQPAEILATDSTALFAELGLDGHLSPLRSNGLASIDKTIRARAGVAAGV
ncbi:MAG: SufE family protein [bacterium]|nr:SufE family protein [bacterium]